MSGFELDPDKATINMAKHKLDLALGRRVFEGDFIETVDDRTDYSETRLIAIGPVASLENRICVTVYTWRGGRRRLISFRKANVDEIEQYRHRHG